MEEILIKAASFVAIIMMGNGLRRRGFFQEEDFYVLSKIVLKITLPAAIITNFSGIDLKPSMLSVSLLGFAGGLLLIGAAYLATMGKGREERAFHVLNLAGYNIGNFTMPFVQGFLGSLGVIITSIFDVGNAFICLGGAFSLAVMIKEGKGGFRLMPVLKTLFRSIPFDTYVLMTLLSLFHISLPAPVVSFTGIIAGANGFMAMLMIGVGFKLSWDREQMGGIVRILVLRYSISIALAAGFYLLLPVSEEYRQVLAILVLSPIGSAAPAFTGNMGGDVGRSSAVNSLSIVISVILITGMLLLIQ